MKVFYQVLILAAFVRRFGHICCLLFIDMDFEIIQISCAVKIAT